MCKSEIVLIINFVCIYVPETGRKVKRKANLWKPQNQDFHSRLTFIGFLILRMWIWARCVGGTMIIFLLSETLSKYPTTSPILTELRFHRSRHHRPVIQIQITVLPFSIILLSHTLSQIWKIISANHINCDRLKCLSTCAHVTQIAPRCVNWSAWLRHLVYCKVALVGMSHGTKNIGTMSHRSLMRCINQICQLPQSHNQQNFQEQADWKTHYQYW